jgi:hypothetical protein
MSTTRKYGGTGLGLNLVKQLVEAHGGQIAVKSKMGAGTSFSFTLKVWDKDRDDPPGDAPAAAGDAGDPKQRTEASAEKPVPR